MLHEDIRSVATALNTHKDTLAAHDPDTWKLLHSAACNLEGLADSAEQLEAHLVPRDTALRDRCGEFVTVTPQEAQQ